MKFAHIADTHIRNLKYHKEYREVFSQLYEKLREERPDYIIHCGDIAHTKTQISPEFVDLCSSFFKNLADIAPTYIILGNHDGNLRNSSRQDALTPIANALDHPNLFLLKDSREVHLDGMEADELHSINYTLNVLSVFDRENWTLPSNPDNINIALYHGAISNSKTDLGWVMEEGEDNVDIFDTFDYGFLGDIHKTNQIIDTKGKIRYPGSTVQQNHAETNDKGFLIWDIVDKEEFTCVHHALKNPKPFVTIKLTPKGRLPNKIDIPQGARLRLVSQNNLPLDVVRRAVDITKKRFKPEAVTYLSRSAGDRGSVENLAAGLVCEDLRDVAVQEQLIEEFLIDYQPSDETLKKVYEMNKKYNAIIEHEEDVKRNINWRLKKLQWDNLFNYGESNSIDFCNISGIVGVLGKNFSGKSSIIDSLLYALFNTTSKNNRKNLNLINQNEDWCKARAEIDIGTKTYIVERTSKKYKKKLKGKVTEEAKTDVEFFVYDNATETETSLNGITRIETDKNIRKVFGTIEDFLTTSMASQLDSLSYLNEGSTRRKEILAKFLDLEFFDRKFKLVKEDSSDLKGAIRKFSDRNYDEEIDESATELARVETKLMHDQRKHDEAQQKMQKLQEELRSVDQQIDSVPEEVIDIRQVIKNLKKLKKETSIIDMNLNKKREVLSSEEGFLQKIENFIDGFNIDNINNQKQIVDEYQERLEQIDIEIKVFEQQRKVIDKKVDLLKSVPCGARLKERCHFVKDARGAVQDVNRVRIGTNQLSLNKETISKKLLDANPTRIDQYIEKYHMILEKKNSKSAEVSTLKLDIEKDKIKLMQAKNILSTLREKEELYEQNKQAIENLDALNDKKLILLKNIEDFERLNQNSKKSLLEMYRSVGSLEQKNTELNEQKQHFCNLQEEFTVADLFMSCVHPNGISYDIIKKRLPIINDEISKILTNIVDFEVFFENDENKLDILIKHPKHDARPIEMGSGAEKTIAAMAIRLALLNVSTLPKGDIFILDEPGTALDAENMEGFISILDMIKTQFKTVLLISHLDSLKDIVDSEISIEKKNGRAYVAE
jgi:exonuclease SbcC